MAPLAWKFYLESEELLVSVKDQRLASYSKKSVCEKMKRMSSKTVSDLSV